MRNVSNAEAQGFEAVERVSVEVRRWRAVQRQLVRLVVGFRHVEREALAILEACRHTVGCPAVEDDARPCLPTCPDRETYLSALVLRANARDLATSTPIGERSSGDYSPPTRETWDALCAEVEALRGGRDVLADLELALAAGETPDPWGLASAHAPTEQPTTRLVLPPPTEGTEGTHGTD